MKKRLSLLLLLGGIVMLCLSFPIHPSKEAVPETLFPETKALHGRTILIDTALFRYPWRIRVNGDRAVVEDLHGPDYFFHLFCTPTSVTFPLFPNVVKDRKKCCRPRIFVGRGMICGLWTATSQKWYSGGSIFVVTLCSVIG